MVQGKLDVLNGAFDELKANTHGLSSQLGRSWSVEGIH